MIVNIDLSSDDDDVDMKTCARNVDDISSDKEMSSSPSPKGRKGRKGTAKSKTALQKKERELMAQERKRKQAMKPGNCMKLIKLVVGADLLQNGYAADLILALEKAEIAYELDANPAVASSICWKRQDPFDEESTETENHIMVFMNAKNFVELVSTNKLHETIQEMQRKSGNKQFTLVIYELDNYFREQVECSLTEVQILSNCGHCFLNSPSQVSSYICQYTKAVAEAPFKREKRSKEGQELEWFAAGDSRGTVRVNKQGHGLARLWRQQLCQFNLAGLESSEAIALQYPSPKALTQAYDGLINEDAQLLLQNIKVITAENLVNCLRIIRLA